MHGMLLEHTTLTGRPAIESDPSTARGAARRSGKRRGKLMEVGTKYSRATIRTLLPLYSRERLGLVASREARKASNQVKSAAYTTMHKTTADTHQAGHSCWIFLHMYFVKVILTLVFFRVKVQGPDPLEDAEGLRHQHAWEAKNGGVLSSFWSQKEDSGQSQGVG